MRRMFIALLLLGTLLSADVVKFSTEIALTGRPMMYIFDSATCPYCDKLKKELNTVPELHALAEGFDIYRIPRDDHRIYNILGKDVSTQELQLSYHVKATPNVVIFNKHAKRMFQTAGYIGPVALAKMMMFVQGVDAGKYKTSEWAQFLYDSKITTSEKARPKTLAH